MSRENASLEEENLQSEENFSEEQAPDAAASDKPAADSSSPDENAVEGDAEDKAGADSEAVEEVSPEDANAESLPDEDSPKVSQDEQAALLNQEDIVDESADDVDVGSSGSGLLSQDEIDNAIQQGGQEDSEGGQDAGGEESMNQEMIGAAINSAVEGPDAGDLKAVEQLEVKKADFQQLSSSDKNEGQRNIDLLMDVELPVSIELGKTKMDISDILGLGPGSVVELEKLVGEPVDLLVNNKCVARGEVVVVEENFGLRITQLISPEERIKNLQ